MADYYSFGRFTIEQGANRLIVVGKPVNLEQVKAVKQAGKAKKAFEALLAEVPAN